MGYKTISIKLMKPTLTKKKILDDAFERYDEAFKFIFNSILEKESSIKNNNSKNQYLKLIDKDIMDNVNSFNVEPFKDSLRIDVAKQLAIMHGNLKNKCSDMRKSKLLKIKGRPIYFCRFSNNREFTLLKDLENERYYVKICLFNRKLSIKKDIGEFKVLQYIASDDEFLKITDSKITYEIFPLQIGKWQEEHLRDIEGGKGVPKSGYLIKKDENIYININIWYDEPKKINYNNFLGVCRGVKNELCYSICDDCGETIKSGKINKNNINGRNKIHVLSNEIISLAKEYKCQIILCNLVKSNDRLKNKDFTVPLSVGQYNMICDKITYKCNLQGFNEPVKVSANSIFFRCPVCDTCKISNRFENDTFHCVVCGCWKNIEKIGAMNLSITLIRYSVNKLRVYYERRDNYIIFTFRAFGITYTCGDDKLAIENFLTYFKEFIFLNTNSLSKKQLSIIKKLSNKNKSLKSIIDEELWYSNIEKSLRNGIIYIEKNKKA